MTLRTASAAFVSCPGCGTPFGAERFLAHDTFACSSCGAVLELELFPALCRPSGTVRTGDALTADGEASCFYHPQKKAAALCEACGRYLCTLCETELSGKCLCPSCIDKGRQNEEIETLVTHRPLHDSIALSLSILPLLFFPATVITAPLALYLAVRNWRRPGSILPRTRVRFVFAGLLSVLQIGGWAVLLVRLAR